MGTVARELSVRKARQQLHIGVAHLPAEENELADYCSRIRQTSKPSSMPECLRGAAEVQLDVAGLWSV